jgi:hypothetical protein
VQIILIIWAYQLISNYIQSYINSSSLLRVCCHHLAPFIPSYFLYVCMVIVLRPAIVIIYPGFIASSTVIALHCSPHNEISVLSSPLMNHRVIKRCHLLLPLLRAIPQSSRFFTITSVEGTSLTETIRSCLITTTTR